MTKVISNSRKDWRDRLVEATWAYNTTWKITTRFTPYELVYGKKALMSIEFQCNTLRMAAHLDLDLTRTQQEIFLELNGLDEFMMQSLLHIEVTQVQRKIWHDKNIKDKKFQEGDSRYKDFKGNLVTRWLGPCVIEKCHDNGLVQIRTIDAKAIPLLFNGYRLKIYKKPLSNQEFINYISKTVMVAEHVSTSTPSSP